MSTNIKGWRERAGLPASYEITNPSAVERALLEEVAERTERGEELAVTLKAIAQKLRAVSRAVESEEVKSVLCACYLFADSAICGRSSEASA